MCITKGRDGVLSLEDITSMFLHLNHKPEPLNKSAFIEKLKIDIQKRRDSRNPFGGNLRLNPKRNVLKERLLKSNPKLSKKKISIQLNPL